MTLLSYFFATALRNLRRGGQRVLVALLCVAFGVMSVVSMTLMTTALERMLLIEPRDLIGADVTMNRIVEDTIFPDHVATLQALQQAGTIDRYTLIAYNDSLIYRLPGSGELNFPSAGMGIDPATYPLSGRFTIDPPGSVAALLQQPGDVFVTRDMLDERSLRLGDTLLLSDLSTGVVVEARIRAIVTDTPNHQGSKIYYSMATARLLAGTQHPENTALLLARDPDAAIAQLKPLGWNAITALFIAGGEKEVQALLKLMFNGSGILGMLVGGIGIANTMQVLLRRRRREVAVYKSLGYTQAQLQSMFLIEAALLGLAGSLIGAALGIAISYGLVGLLSGITDLLIQWVFAPLPVINSILVGLITTVSFAMFAIVITSRVRPLAVLRSEALDASTIPWFQSLALALLCGLPFAAVTVLVMGSLLQGIGILLFALFGLVALGLFLGGLVWLITRLLPLRAWPLLHMARNNLKRRGTSLIFAMVALFIGVVSLAIGIVVSTSAQRALDTRLIKFEGDNITVIAPAVQQAALQRAIAAQPSIEHVSFGYQTPVRSIQVVGKEDSPISPLLIGRDELSDFTISAGAPWGTAPNGVYAFDMFDIPVGSQVTVSLPDGAVHTLPVVGLYKLDLQGANPRPEMGLLMSSTLSQSILPPETVQFFCKAPAAQVNQVSQQLGTALPQATVINLPAYAARFTRVYSNLFNLSISMAGLALLAGVLLVANSVSLAMLNRRYEIGVLKAMGYARRQVLFTLVVEYSLVAVIATTAGLVGVQIFLWILGLVDKLAGSLLVMSPTAAALIALVSIGLTLLTVLGVTWRPVQVSPVVILNDRE